ncbi:hypothetical protein GCM10010329_78000 [Streptomyces spiroverticillatus]|uniref:Uncharacterized protein n=1 Tax=Streptomyces finlayi TaxID=67296 RepID=A0A918X5C8_9ACTN|nr:hypothetical protein [Streptomyces finlayi]GHA43510.1 hypothetical protein GCM10010329_78000 [Streptomyces spiroverticillatus]GHD13335.1 hypothetical protein GCM10010334_71350 [Streptomyces finlayi]
MTATPQAISMLRRTYTGESVQQARQAVDALGPDAPPIPPAATPQQVLLESRVLLSLLEFRNVFTRYPLGIAAVRPEPDSVSLRVESEERAAEILFNLLPSYVSDEEVYGVPGLRITRRARTAIELQVLGQPARLRLTGIPARSWRKAIEQMLEQWTNPDDALLCWKSSPRAWTSAEIQHRTRWNNPGDRFTQEQRRGDWLGSGLLRRAALLHTVSNTYFLDGYRSEITRLVLRSSHTPGRGPGPHRLVAALVDPAFGLPLRLQRFRGDTDERLDVDQQFVLCDPAGTAVLDLRATVERPSSRMPQETWNAVLRRLPPTEDTQIMSPDTLAVLCRAGAA